MARNVADTTLLLQNMAGHDERDAASVTDPVPDYSKALAGSMRGIRVGVLDAYMELAHPEVRSATQSAIETLSEMGAKILKVDLPHWKEVEPAHSLILGCEGACFHERRFREQMDLIDPAVLQTLLPAKFRTATDYIKAQRLRTIVMNEVEAVFKQCDVIVCPTMTVLPYKLDLSGAAPQSGANIRALANLTGIPAISIPCGFSSESPTMPIGMMLHAKPFDEVTLLRVAHAYEQATDWHKRRPSIS
jgi:aspartyl-tRNA(Asn)/glutamyl-tRNA(Gln) amidotransferase subunit A